MALPYRPNVCMLLYNASRELWIGERYGASTWQFPQGGALRRLTPEENVIRELREELGLKRKHLGGLTLLEATHRYDFARTPPHWKGRWRGQEQTFWAVRFLGKDEDIDLTRHHPQEFSRWAWCPFHEVLERVEPIRRAGYEEPLRQLARLWQDASADLTARQRSGEL